MSIVTGNFTVNLQTDALISVLHNKAVALCLQRYAPVPPYPHLWNALTCTYYNEWTQSENGQAKQDSVSYPLRSVIYFYGLAFLNESATGEVKALFDGPVCPAAQVWDGTACVGLTPIGAEFPALGKGYVRFTVPPVSGSFVLASESFCGVSFLGRFQGSPSHSEPTFYDFWATDIVTQHIPRSGEWTVLVDNTCNQTVKLSLTTKQCPAGKAGPDCSITLQSDAFNLDFVLKQNETMYFMTNTTSKQPLFVVARAVNGDENKARIYASYNQIPALEQTAYDDVAIDLSACNQDYCELTDRIQLDSSAVKEKDSMLWYLGILI